MIPRKSKRKNLEMTIEEMRNFATAYVEKYAPSKQQLKTYLLKKYLKSSVPSVKKENISDLVNLVTEDLEKTKFINDRFYSESKAKNLIQKGSSINKIRNYLISKGIQDEHIKQTINKIKEQNEDQDFFSAIKICKKKELVQLEKKIIDLCFIKKIYQYWQDQDSILKHLKKLWILKKTII